MTVAKTESLRVILGTGGTIAGRSGDPGDNVGYVAGEVGVSDLLAAVPPLRGLKLESEQVAQLDSKDMDFPVWRRLAERLTHHLAREEVQGIVVTHGTDTIEETAWFLHTVLQPRKPVVLTCAMRPATALVPDGPQNLLDAVAVSGCKGLSGVVVVCAGLVHSARDVAKVHSYRVDAFESGDAGPLGCVEEGVVRWFHPLPAELPCVSGRNLLLDRVLQTRTLPRVSLITSHADSDGTVVRGLVALAERYRELKTDGIVVACTGNGTLHTALQAALQEAQDCGIRVVRATRCARGRVIPSKQALFSDSDGLSPVKARLALSLSILADRA